MKTFNQNFPACYKPEKVGQLYLPDIARAAQAGQEAGLSRADLDKNPRIMLLLIDAQVDFILPQGSLAVPGAVEDTRRTIEWIYRNAGQITNISASLDSHTAFQIFSPGWWINEAGKHPEPFTPISLSDVENGTWRPVWEPEWSRSYVRELDKGAKYVLMIWPYHTMIGTPGNSLVPALSEAVMYHASARQTQPTWLVKGSIPESENYSILEPEVKISGNPLGDLNISFLETLQSYDLIYVGGQAKSHCVLSTMRSITTYFKGKPETIKKFRFLLDCTSSVQHPEIDFEALATAELAQMETLGMKLVTSLEPIG